MVKQLVEYDTAAGKKVYVEVEVPEQAPVGEPGGAPPTPAAWPAQGNFEDKLQEALDAAEPAFTTIRDKFKSFEPKTIDLTFGLSLSAGLSVWVITAKGSATLGIKLHWEGTSG